MRPGVRVRRWWGGLAVGFLIAACEGGARGPGALSGVLEGPTPLGVAIVEVRGAGVLGFEGVGGTRVFDALMSEGVHRIVLVGEEAGDLAFRVRVSDVRNAPPTAALISAADGQNLPVSSVQPFRVRLSR